MDRILTSVQPMKEERITCTHISTYSFSGQWEGMEIYPNRLLNIKITSLSDNMMSNDIVINALYVEDKVRT